MTQHVTRRGLMGGTAAMALLGRQALAQAPAVSPPKVWLDLDQKALDEAYDQSIYAPNIAQVQKRYAINSELARQRLGPPQRLAYGDTPIEALDVWRTTRADAPIVIYVHGGAWRAGLARDHAYAAEMLVSAGAHLVVPDFINVVESGGDLMPMAEQVRRAVAWVHRNARGIGGDPARIHVIGHSSGAHLGGVALVTDWPRLGAPAGIIRSALLVSGMYDLKPVRLSARSRYVAFTDAVEDALSTQRHLARIACPVTLAYGTLETPEFQRQSRDFAAALRAAGKPVELVVAEGYNHFEIAETLANPHGAVGRVALAMLGLRPA